MSFLGAHFAIGDSLHFAAQTKSTSTGTPTDADSLPTYQIYEQGGTTAITSGSFAKRDDANTTGYYEASVDLTTAAGFEFGKSYVIRKLATVSSTSGIAIDRFSITGAGVTTVSALTDWPTTSDVDALIDDAGITLRDSVTTNRKQRVINAVVQEVLHKTKRQFVAGDSATTRYFDGSGTGMLEVDEMVSLSSVEVIGFSAVGATQTLDNVYLAADNEYPKTRILIAQGSPYSAAGVYFSRFPQGRRNIKVTGVYGYASAIPQDLWEGVASEVAARLAIEAGFDEEGKLESWKEADVDEKYKVLDAYTGLYWHQAYVDAVNRYRRPPSRRFRHMKAPMV